MTISRTITRALVIAAGALLAAVLTVAPAAAAKDRNHDKIPDRWEVRHGLSLKKNQARRNQDHDGLKNRSEFLAKFDPRDSDTDDDGVEDGDEGAGTIESFDPVTGILVINPFNGDQVTGLVTDETEIECENDDDTQPDVDGDDGPNDDQDEDNGDDDNGDEVDSGHGHARQGTDDDNCSVADLTAGTIVHEAELELTSLGLVFEEIEL